MSVAIKADNLRKIYSGNPPVVALKSASLEINDNEFFTLLGPSGCGKTTLLRLIAGFESITAGELCLYGNNISNLPPEIRPVNTVFQHYSLFPHMTILDNVAFGLRRLGTDKNKANSVAQEMLDLVHLGEYGARKPDQLSGGQQQRVALARALTPQPKVLLLDEPLSALDLKLRQAMRSELKRLQRETGITFVFVTHDQEEALSMSDRIAVMSAGEIQQIATPDEIYERPANRFVADFIGDANFYDAVAGKHKDELVEYIIDDITSLKGQRVESIKENDKVTLAIRPEKVSFVKAGDKDTLAGTVSDIMYLGNTTDYLVILQNNETIKVRAENHHNGEAIANVGEPVSLAINPAALRILKK